MARARRRHRHATGLNDLLVLDAQGLSKAADLDPTVQVWLERARELDADIVVSAVTLAEVLRGVARDAARNRVVKAGEIWPADEAVGRAAGTLLGRAGSDHTVDAVVAATALDAQRERSAARCVVLTSDPGDLSALLAESATVHVIRI
ncbi:MAG: PIN domain-containing protein [Sporichthyaceae bacterium]